MEKSDSEMLAAILVWAYEHHIDVSFSRQHLYGGDSCPVIRFSRGDKHIEQKFWPLSEISPMCRHIWHDIGRKLCVSEPKWITRSKGEDTK